jgi:diadenosine tetraphosphate (Ap4A) HIT family hydrolase
MRMKNVVAFHDINPQAPIHLLIVPKKHIASVMEIDDEENLLLKRIILKWHKI